MNWIIMRIRENNFRKITFYKVRLRLQQNHNNTTDVHTADRVIHVATPTQISCKRIQIHLWIHRRCLNGDYFLPFPHPKAAPPVEHGALRAWFRLYGCNNVTFASSPLKEGLKFPPRSLFSCSFGILISQEKKSLKELGAIQSGWGHHWIKTRV